MEKTYKLNAHSSYDIICKRGIINEAGTYVRERIGEGVTAYVISDSTVFPIYGQMLMESLEKEGIAYHTYVFPAGERSKNTDTLIAILNDMAHSALSRSDVVIALGGGVTGDISGLAASLYERGVRCIQIPTTLLAAVDSSVGGKTAVNLEAGKNLCGAFHRPSLVLFDFDTLKTLPSKCIGDGYAEMIKYGIIYDAKLFGELSNGHPSDAELEEMICRCIQIKIDVVEKDEFEGGIRMLLNYGHTFGHAIEKLSDYAISHGHAVAIGSCLAAKAAQKLGICDGNVYDMTVSALKNASLPVACEYSGKELYECMLADKKRRGNRISIILPRSIGVCEIRSFTLDELCELMEAL